MGTSWKVVYYISTTGENPVSDFLDTLQKQTQSKIIRILHNIEEYGLQSVIPHIKKMSGTPFWEIRILGQDNIRVIYVVFVKSQILVLHGFIKKTDKTPIKELEIVNKRYQIVLSGKNRH